MAATAATAKAQATVLGKIVGLSSGKTQQIPEEPTEQEIEDYALWLGLDKVKDRDLFWIAKQALRTPIPQPWVQCQTASGDVFFHNTKTKESVWDHPYDQYYQQAVEQYKNGKSSREELTGQKLSSVDLDALSIEFNNEFRIVGSETRSPLLRPALDNCLASLYEAVCNLHD